MRILIKTLLYISFLLTICWTASAYRNITKGTEFWFAYTSGGMSGRLQVTCNKPTSGTISVPGMGWSQNFTIAADSIVSLSYNEIWYLNKSRRNIVTDLGVHVVTKDPVTVLSSDDSNIGDHTLILPVNGLGAEYRIATYDVGSLSTDSLYDCLFYIIAADSNTIVEIQTRLRYSGGPPIISAPFNITLHKGQSYLVAEDGDLTGSSVRCLDTTKKIAVFSGNHQAIIDKNCSDTTHFLHPIWEQLYSKEMLGTEYVVLPYKYRNNGNMIRVMGVEDGTHILLSDTNRIILNNTMFYDTIAFEPVIIKSDKPISVTLFSRNKKCSLPKPLQDTIGEPTMLQLMPVERMYTGSVVFKTLILGANNSKRYVSTVFTKTTNIDKIFFDGKSFANLFQPLKKYPGYSYAHVDMDFNIHKLESNIFYSANHYAFCANGSTYEWDGGYSLSLGAGKDYINFTTNPVNPFCAGLPVEYIGIGPNEVKNWYWDFGNGDNDTGKVVVYAYPKPGTYKLTLRVKLDSADKDIWDVYQRDVIVVDFLSPKITTTRLVKCPDEQITLSVNDNYRNYKWSTGEMMPAIKIKKSGTYSVTVTDTSGCVDYTEIEIKEFSVKKPVVTLTGASAFCNGDSSVLTAPDGYVSYRWSNDSTSKSILVKEPGIYKVWVTDDNGCTSASDGLEIMVYQNPQPIINGLNSVCKNTVTDYFIKVFSNEDIKWTVTGGTKITRDDSLGITVRWGGYGKGKVYIKMVSKILGCTGVDSIDVTIDSTLKPALSQSNKFLCKGETVTISADKGYATYLWSTNDTTSEIVVSKPGKYSLSVSGAAGCKGTSDVIDLQEVEKPKPAINGPDIFCMGDSVMLESDKTFVQYLWSNGATTSSIRVSSPGKYILNVTDDKGCSGTTEHNLVQSDVKLTQLPVINFGKVKIGKNKNRKVKLFNLAADTVFISSIKILGKEGNAYSAQTVPQSPFYLAPGKSVDISVDLLTSAERYYVDSLIIETSIPCFRHYNVECLGLGSVLANETLIYFPYTTSTIGTKNFRIPLKFRLTAKDTTIQNLGFKTQISFRKNFFFPDSITRGKLTSNTVDNDNRVLTIEDSLRTVTGYDSLLTEISGIVLLGEKQPTPLTIDSFEWSDEDIIITPQNGSLSVNGVCQQTISQIKLSDVPSLKIENEKNFEKIIFNVSGLTNKPELFGKYEIKLYSIFGIEIFKTDWNYSGEKSGERYIFESDGSMIASGAYFVVFKSPVQLTTYSLFIVR